MHNKSIAIVVGLLVLLGGSAFLLATLLSSDDGAVVHWQPPDEIAVDDPNGPDAAASGDAGDQLARQAVAILDGDRGSDARVDTVLRGRVVDHFQAPVAAALVYLDFGRGGMRGGRGGGPQRRIPDPVRTDGHGRFAFQGQLFTNVRLTLQVTHPRFAPALFDRTLTDVKAEMELGDLVVDGGGEVLGRVTDLSGNAVPTATVRLQPENDNRLRWVRNRDELLPAAPVDNNGYFRLQHVAAGDWHIAAVAPRHQNGGSPMFAVESDQRSEVDDIKLGPGFDVSGTVVDGQQQPVAKADVSLRERRNGRDYRTTTDAAGHFQLEHLPGIALQLTVEAKGYLRYEQSDLDPTFGKPVFVALQEGLKITGIATDAESGQPVVDYAVRADRLRGLPRTDGQEELMARLEALGQQMRAGSVDEAARQEMERLRQQVAEADQGGPNPRMGGGRGRGPGGPGNMFFGGDIGKTEAHRDGRFTMTGLQEGIYRVTLQSPEHTRWRSAEIELRVGTAPEVAAVLAAGLSVFGTVLDAERRPIADARVELRTADANQGGGRRGRGDNGDRFGQMLRRFGMQGMIVAEAKTDAAGHFALRHAASGTYRVSASARNHDVAQSDIFELAADRSGVELVLGRLGSIAGTVRGVGGEHLGEAIVVALPVGDTSMRPGMNNPMAQIQADGRYRIDDLPPGDYAVRAALGGVGELWREYAMQLMNGSLPADVKVTGGAVVAFDPILELPKTGTVSGTLMHNGVPGKGLQVSLRPVDDGSGQGPGMRGRGGMRGRNLDASVGANGGFTIKDVPAGTYTVSVSLGGRRGGAPLHRQQLQVQAQQQAELDLQVTTSSLHGRVSCEDATDPATLSGNLLLLPGLTEMPSDFGAMRRDGTAINTRVQAGAFAVEALPAGQYLAVLNVRGRERTLTSLFVTAGDNSAVQLPAGKLATATEVPSGAPTANPRGQGGRGNRGQNVGGRRGGL